MLPHIFELREPSRLDFLVVRFIRLIFFELLSRLVFLVVLFIRILFFEFLSRLVFIVVIFIRILILQRGWCSRLGFLFVLFFIFFL